MNIRLAETLKPLPDKNSLGFGRYFTDHMFVMDYCKEKGWHSGAIVPYAPLELEPSAMVFHYGQAIFEGMKAYKSKDDKILLFRPTENLARANISGERLCIPAFDEGYVLKALIELLKIEKRWIPGDEGTSLYIRPFIIATDPYLGVRPSHTYKFLIILSPVGAYYPEGLNPVKIFVESEYVRAAKGGVGYTKTPGNYAASIKAQLKAQENGFTQVLWLDALHKKYVEEVGTMNVFFKMGETVYTPKLNGSILAGITRDSVIKLLKSWDIDVSESTISIEQIYEAHAGGKLSEAFGTGTAAVISPIGELKWGDRAITISGGKTGALSQRLYDSITQIQSGLEEDPFEWVLKI